MKHIHITLIRAIRCAYEIENDFDFMHGSVVEVDKFSDGFGQENLLHESRWSIVR